MTLNRQRNNRQKLMKNEGQAPARIDSTVAPTKKLETPVEPGRGTTLDIKAEESHHFRAAQRGCRHQLHQPQRREDRDYQHRFQGALCDSQRSGPSRLRGRQGAAEKEILQDFPHCFDVKIKYIGGEVAVVDGKLQS
jgi:hypothetical protein